MVPNEPNFQSPPAEMRFSLCRKRLAASLRTERSCETNPNGAQAKQRISAFDEKGYERLDTHRASEEQSQFPT